MHLTQKITVSSDVLAQEVAGEIVLLDLNSEQYLGLNEVGARVWQLLEESIGLEVIFGILREEFIQIRGLRSRQILLILFLEELRFFNIHRSKAKLNELSHSNLVDRS